MDQDRTNPDVSRRSFLRAAGLSAVAAGTATGTAAVVTPRPAQATTQLSAGYRETEHVRQVYALARF
jgi:nitrous oxide reductase